MASTRRRTNPCAFIESRGGVLYNEFMDIVPTEFKAKSKKEREQDQKIAWESFDRELAMLIKKRRFGLNSEGGVEKNDKV